MAGERRGEGEGLSLAPFMLLWRIWRRRNVGVAWKRGESEIE